MDKVSTQPKMSQTNVHIINHTHWDREWFLTSVYTSQWIPRLIDKLTQLARQNPDFHYLFDGQTLVIEDLLRLDAAYEANVQTLIQNGNLTIGPYYCQPDWQLAGGETLIRNLWWGIKDVQAFNGRVGSGWLVDTFGHISQAPQIHQLFGIETVFVWRGVPQMVPFFNWKGADGQTLFAVDLFGGYRNLYGVTHVPEVALARLEGEVEKLRPYYPQPHIPLFDGYDLEDNPEDPLTFYRETAVPDSIHLQESSPAEFAQTVRTMLTDLPVIQGELNSGKFGATFPGTFSGRTYLKVMQADCEKLLYQLCEPLAALAALHGREYDHKQYETWSRQLLQNSVHDCLCGVSIDQVHEKMEIIYKQIYEGVAADVQMSLAAMLHDFAPGLYAVSTNPMPHQSWQEVAGQLYEVQTEGLGIWPLTDHIPVKQTDTAVSDFTWQNAHYTARVSADGVVQIGEARVGQLLVQAEQGDTYSDESGAVLGVCQPVGPLLLEQESKRLTAVRFHCQFVREDVKVEAVVRLLFDQSPLLRWQIELDSRGTDFRVDLHFDTAVAGQIWAGMPFDMVPRQPVDQTLLPRELPEALAGILLGQRELNAVRTFPFHEWVGVSDEKDTAVIFGKGLRSYQAAETGEIAITLRRSVEWVTTADLQNRIGDAGPFFYVPDARCERTVRHEVAFCVGDFKVDSADVLRLNNSFKNAPLLVRVSGNGQRRDWPVWRADCPMSSLFVQNEQLLLRLFNPSNQAVSLPVARPETDVWGNVLADCTAVAPKKIITLQLAEIEPNPGKHEAAAVQVLNFPKWRVGENCGLPDTAVLSQLAENITRLEKEIATTESAIQKASGREQLILRHHLYALQREMVEYELSHHLNELKTAVGGKLDHDYLFKPDKKTEEIGLRLNQLRIKRRIFDYVVATLQRPTYE